MKNLLFKIFAPLTFGLALCQPAVATTTLADLINSNGNIVVGDLVFSNFAYSFTGEMAPADSINVLTLSNANGTEGIRFQGAFLDLYDGDGVSTGTGSDAFISYTVSVLDPGTDGITEAHLAANTLLLGDGPGIVSITETFLPEAPGASMNVFDVKPGSTNLIDWVSFDGLLTSINVQKDIAGLAAALGSVATISFIDQTYKTTEVPEPASAALLLSGLIAGGRIRRKKVAA
ncbi:hypothetical protein BVY02_01590 [bacterium J17]|nr:hypothetical protein BVY02_01590 [bacterium J17]